MYNRVFYVDSEYNKMYSLVFIVYIAHIQFSKIWQINIDLNIKNIILYLKFVNVILVSEGLIKVVYIKIYFVKLCYNAVKTYFGWIKIEIIEIYFLIEK